MSPFHCHDITIHVKSKTINKTTKHRDGTLSYPCYNAFLLAKIYYFIKNSPDVPIFVHPDIPNINTFYDEIRCKKW